MNSTKFQHILDGLPPKPPRSRLEPYRVLIEKLRRRRRTYREIACILAEKCDVRVSLSALHDFVRRRSLERLSVTKAVEAQDTDPAIGPSRPNSAIVATDEMQRQTLMLKSPADFAGDNNATKEIAKRGTLRSSDREELPRFEYDEDEPLYLLPKTGEP